MEEVIRKYFQCWLDKDIDAVKEIFSDDIILFTASVMVRCIKELDR